jgi:transcriptional regulator with XRE-family HTH domain
MRILTLVTTTVNIVTMTRLSNNALGTEVNGLIARRIAQLRKAQNLSFDALAARSDISKGMLVAIEQGSANPSIGTLCKLAAALRVSLADLLGQDEQTSSAVQVVTPDQANDLWRGPKGGLATLLVGRAGPDMLELWEWTLFPGEEFQSKGHPKGTVELLSVTEGTLALAIDGVDHLIATSHRGVALTDRPHGYRCHGKKRTRFAMVVYEPALGPYQSIT